MAAGILCIFLLPFICNNFIIRNSNFRPFYCCAVWFFSIICLLLGWIGGLPVIFPYLLIGQYLTSFFFFWILILFPFIGIIEKAFYTVYGSKLYQDPWAIDLDDQDPDDHDQWAIGPDDFILLR